MAFENNIRLFWIADGKSRENCFHLILFILLFKDYNVAFVYNKLKSAALSPGIYLLTLTSIQRNFVYRTCLIALHSIRTDIEKSIVILKICLTAEERIALCSFIFRFIFVHALRPAAYDNRILKTFVIKIQEITLFTGCQTKNT